MGPGPGRPRHRSQLFSPFTLRGLTFRNRVFVSPMCQYSSEDGFPTDWHLVHYGSRAVGGAGLVMLEAIAVSQEGRLTPCCGGMWSDDRSVAFARIARFVREQGAAPGIQLSHGGRKASTDLPWLGGRPLEADGCGWQTVAPSPIAFAPDYPVPREATVEDLDVIRERFADGARRALAAGFQVLEIHMAHGYLLHEFLSPLTNHRTDDFGGSIENRMRFPLSVAKTVRGIWSDDLPVFVRISATDWVEGGWDLEQSLELCRRLQEIGIDLVDCSGGGLVHRAAMPVGPGFMTPFATAIRQQVGIPTSTVGLITDPVQAEQIVATGLADAVFLARESLRDPYWPMHAAKELGADHEWPVQYLRADVSPKPRPKAEPAGDGPDDAKKAT
jgi:2,4-dienoyl-CoA reductase-like NADH-dependent reductase (Old Yellow Enzyme family)